MCVSHRHTWPAYANMTNFLAELQQQKCGYHFCDRTREYCEEGVFGEGLANTCIPCSRICSGDGSDDFAVKRCITYCPVYAYRKYNEEDTTCTASHEEKWRIATIVLGCLVVLLFCWCCFHAFRNRRCLKLDTLFKRLARKEATDCNEHEEGSPLSAENQPSADRQGSAVHGTESEDNESSVMSRLEGPVQEESPEHNAELCV